MKEVEAKILEIDGERVRHALSDMGAQKVFDGEVRTMFLDFEDRRIVKVKDVLRLRKEGETAELTYKKVRFTQTSKNAEETTVEISSLEDAKRILENLGLHVTEDMEKHRVSYKLGRVRFDIDRYSGNYAFIPEFMEIEAENAEAIHKYAELLGFKPQDCLPWSTNELISHYAGKQGSRL